MNDSGKAGKEGGGVAAREKNLHFFLNTHTFACIKGLMFLKFTFLLAFPLQLSHPVHILNLLHVPMSIIEMRAHTHTHSTLSGFDSELNIKNDPPHFFQCTGNCFIAVSLAAYIRTIISTRALLKKRKS